jgi:glycosyltransferase involved in cell wall biosynthesis
MTTDVGARAEAVVEGETGLDRAPDHGKGLVDALELLVENPGLRWKMGQVGRERAEAKFDTQQNASKIVEILQGIA